MIIHSNQRSVISGLPGDRPDTGSRCPDPPGMALFLFEARG